ncbi:major facilitator superfamily domain-containing protein 6-like isoform X2 [Gouania willdenowi]|uniref:major facilitator superfamily domain-containing protein 6-like isoform X2 n=1 Tax=Gouania willdenowi TaxID=441366 RepID=UPI0010549982|nr:major facilitator superfamily domain-containing protein 6-like isoform X2 [Gouania willdenowi]
MMKRNKQIDINRALALAGTFNFLHSCGKACLLPFLTLYFRQLGLTPAMTGMVIGAKHLISLVWTPVASLLAKHYNKRRVVINGCLVSSAVVALLLLLLPPVDVNRQRIRCNSSDEQSVSMTPPTTPSLSNSTSERLNKSSDRDEPHPQSVTIGLNNSDVHPKVSSPTPTASVTGSRNKRSEHKSKHPQMKEEKPSNLEFLGRLKVMDTQHQLFFLILMVVSAWTLVSAPLGWTVDDGLYEYLDFADASDRYRSSGLWGLLGAACGVGGAGVLVSQLSCRVDPWSWRSAAHFYCYTCFAAVTVPVATYLPLYLNKKRDWANGLLKALQLVRGSPHALLCVVTVLLVGAGASAVENFLLWQMEDHGSSELHMGLSLALALVSQACYPLLAAKVSKVLSPGKVLTVGAAGLGVQCFYYSFLWGPWAALPAQLLTSFSSGAVWWAVKVQCDDIATPGADRSVNRVFSSLALHLGRALGSFTGGFAAQRFGLAWLFRGAAIALMSWCVILPVLQYKVPNQRRINYSRLLAADASEASDSESEQEKDWLDKAMESERRKGYGRRVNH